MKMNKNLKRFVIHKHTQGDYVHWDLMLEAADYLTTFRLDRPPEIIAQQPVRAVKIFDHQLKFLTYEGTVNKGTGSVQLAETGVYQTIQKDENRVEMKLMGKILKGRFVLSLVEDDKWVFTPIF